MGGDDMVKLLVAGPLDQRYHIVDGRYRPRHAGQAIINQGRGESSDPRRWFQRAAALGGQSRNRHRGDLVGDPLRAQILFGQ